MLIPFTLDPDVFRESSVSLDCLKRHDALVQLWGLIGQLVIPGDKESKSKLLDAFSKAPQKVQLRWRDAFKHYRKRCGESKFAEALNSDVPVEKESICGGIRLASLEESRGELWGLGDEQYSKLIANSLEICRFGHEDKTEIVRKVLALAERAIEVNESPEVVWRDRFRDLASDSRVVTIVDRYAIKEFMSPHGNVVSGLERLMSNTAALASPGKKIMHLYSAYSLDWKLHGTASSFNAACRKIVETVENACHALRGKSLSEVHVHIAGDQNFGSVVHYRYVLFDDKNLIQLDTGLEPLGGDWVKRTCTVKLVHWLSPEAKAYREDEKKLRAVIECSNRIDCNN